MYIERLWLRNFGPHENFKQDLVQGLIGIIGPNGSGKSTIVDAAYYILTGDLSRFKGVKSDNIRDGAGDEPAFAQGDFVIRGVPVSIRRNLRSSTSWMKVRDKKITSAKEMKEQLSALGVEKHLLDNYVFVAQKRLGDFLIASDGQRAETFQKLCGTMKAEEIVKAIAAFRKSNPGLTTDVVDNSDELRRSLAKAKNKLKSALAEQAAAAAKQLPEEDVEECEKLVQLRQRRAELTAEKRKSLAKLSDLTEKFAAAKKELEVSDSELAAAEANYAKLLKRSDAVNAAESAWSRYLTYRKNKSSIEESIPLIEAELAKPLPPQVIPSSGLDAKIAEYSHQLSQAKKLVETGEGVCDACGQPVTADSVEDASREIERLESELEKAKAELQFEKESAKAYEDAVRNRENQSQRLADLRGRLKDLVAEEKPAIPVDKIEGYRDEFESAKESLDDLRQENKDLTSGFSEAKERRKAAADRLGEIEAEFKANPLTKEAYEQAKEKLDKHEAACSDVTTFKAEADAHRENVVEYKNLLHATEKKIEKYAALKAFDSRLETLHSIFHRTALPRAVAAENLVKMEQGINKNLAVFNSPFVVEATEDLSFNCFFPGRDNGQPASRISVGQLSVLAIAFHQQALAQFAGEIGLMSLDEPTAALDESNVSFLREALSRYAATLSGNAQVFMITHNLELKSAFEQIIHVGAASK